MFANTNTGCPSLTFYKYCTYDAKTFMHMGIFYCKTRMNYENQKN